MARILKYTSVNLANNDLAIQNELSEELKSLIEIRNNPSLEPETESEAEKTDEELREEFLEQARLEAQEIIKQAEQQAEQLKLHAQREAEQLKAKSQEDGFAQGHEEGINQSNLECAELKAEAQTVLDNAKKERTETIQKFEADIIQFILSSIQKILTEEYKFNPDIIKFIIKKGFSSIKKLDNIKIYVSTENYEILKDEKVLAGIDIQKNNIEVLEDETLTPNDCNIETQMGSINCGVTEQFNSLKQALVHMI